MGDLEVNYYVLILFVVGALFLAWEVFSFLRFKSKIVVKAKMPSQNITFPIIAVLFCYIALKNLGIKAETIALCALYVVIFVFALFLNCGLTEKGIVVQGILSKYDRIRYYTFDFKTAKNPRLRFGLGFQEKFLEVEEDKVELIKAYFYKYRVPSFEEYIELKKEAKKKEDEKRFKK